MTSLKIHRCVLAYGFIEYRPFTIKTDRNSIYDPHITDRLYLMVFAKIVSLPQKQAETLDFLVVSPIFQISYT
jgi:hypothetical protein